MADRRASTRLCGLKTNRRLADHLRLSIEAHVFDSVDPNVPLTSYGQDDYLQFKPVDYFL